MDQFGFAKKELGSILKEFEWINWESEKDSYHYQNSVLLFHSDDLNQQINANLPEGLVCSIILRKITNKSNPKERIFGNFTAVSFENNIDENRISQIATFVEELEEIGASIFNFGLGAFIAQPFDDSYNSSSSLEDNKENLYREVISSLYMATYVKQRTILEFGLQKDFKIVEFEDTNFKIVGETLIGYLGPTNKIITIPDGVKTIEKAVFSNMPIKKVRLPNSLNKICENAFWCCRSLEQITGFKNVCEIKDRAFYQCISLVNVDLGESLISIGESAFGTCYSMTDVILPKTLKRVGRCAFGNILYGTTTIKNVFYRSSKTSFDRIEFDIDNDSFKEAKIYFYSEKQPSGSDNSWHFVNNKPSIW